MLKIGLIALLVLTAATNYAQQDYFVLIQSDSNQPFYVHMADKIFPSSPHGYLVLPQLKEGDYSAAIGFPGHLLPDQQFSFSIHNKDLDLQLKDLGDKGWGLFNPQTQEWRMPEKKEDPASGTRPEGVKKDDAFSRLMAAVVSDTAVMYNNYAAAPPSETPPPAGPVDSLRGALVKTDSLRPAPDTPASGTAPSAVVAVVPAGKAPSAVVSAEAPPSVVVPAADSAAAVAPRAHGADTIVRISERWYPRSIRIVYADRAGGGKTDTVQVIIPLDTALRQAKHPVNANTGNRLAAEQPAEDKSQEHLLPEHAPQSAANTGKSVAAANNGPVSSTPAASTPAVAVSGGASATVPVTSGEGARNKPDSGQKKAASKLQVVNSDCKNFASDYDVDRLRVKMLEAVKDEDRIQIARKVFKSKCFTTRQIRALSEVFTTDALRYRFFEAAYPFVADDRFYELSDLLADPAYNSKFRIMTGH